MTRPRKQTVDYFPHYCHHGKTMSILEQKYGNDGYAFWFKLLELLGSSEGHSIDCNETVSWEFLQSVTRLNPETCLAILNLLARLNAIDPNLWAEKIIWSDNFLQGITYAYRNRVLDIPEKPSILRKKPLNQGQSDARNPHNEVNRIELNRKEMNRREDISLPATALPSPPVCVLPSFTVQDLARLWNEKAPRELRRINLPLARKEKDMAKIRDAVKRHPDPLWWEALILLLDKLPFVKGVNDRGWKITLDILVRDAELITDGKYESRKNEPKGYEALRNFAQKGEQHG